jgi:hypothetical protein
MRFASGYIACVCLEATYSAILTRPGDNNRRAERWLCVRSPRQNSSGKGTDCRHLVAEAEPYLMGKGCRELRLDNLIALRTTTDIGRPRSHVTVMRWISSAAFSPGAIQRESPAH